jgi:hypothetical protein
MTFRNAAHTTGKKLASGPARCAKGYYKEEGGGAIFIRDAVTRIFNSTFTNNKGPALGPDVGGGAIFVHGNLETTIVGSTFSGNSAANGGAVGSNNGNVSIYDSVFTGNSATGHGSNNVDTNCPSKRRGSGGLGGAVYLDGEEKSAVFVCDSRFAGNKGGSNGGAIFRTKNSPGEGELYFNRNVFNGNKSSAGGAAFLRNYRLSIRNSTFSNNAATDSVGGGLFVIQSTLNLVNNTFYSNDAAKLGGALYTITTSGNIVNQTFADNRVTNGDAFSGVMQISSEPKAVNIRNSLMIDNIGRNCGAPMTCAGGKFTGGPNLQWPSTKPTCNKGKMPDTKCTSQTAFAKVSVPDVLAMNGGSTPNLVPSPGSAAKGRGTNCPSTDQRGKKRPANGCTLGAVE